LRLWGAAIALLALGAGNAALERLESAFAELQESRCQLETTKARGATSSLAGASLERQRTRHAAARREFAARLGGVRAAADSEDARAVAAMRHAYDEDAEPEKPLTPETPGKPSASETGQSSVATAPLSCEYDAAALAAGPHGLESLRARLYACFGQAAQRLSLGAETVDRLTLLERVRETSDPEARRRIFLALAPLWRTVNADGGPLSPYRRLVAATAASKADAPLDVRARELGLDPVALEAGLVSILQAWRDASPEAPSEPWDFWYASETASRTLAAHVPKASLPTLNRDFYRSLGADPEALGIHFDLEPRPDKTPVAFTDFGAPARLRGGTWTRGEFWVFATYRTGGLGNLVELLHETGHGIHIAAIRTRPAFATWPDSDSFTEALADVPALEAYEPEWQRQYLGSSAELKDSLRSKYASIVLDVAWALFEVRMLREPSADPNQVWTALTEEYLHIAPHPELSWWAMRGQLVDAPGYMINYAIGAVLAADVRARVRELRGPFWRGDPACYAWLSSHLYRFGLERSSRQVLLELLGRAPSPAALLSDMARMRAAGPPQPSP
jgi:hypothetical protein